MQRQIRFFALGFFAVWILSAQRPINTGNSGIGGNNPGTGIGTVPGSGTGTPSTQPANPFPDTGSFPGSTQTPIFISGKVMLDDGTAPDTSVAIQRVCSGAPRVVAYTTGKGNFSFQWGNTAGIMPDASESSQLGGRMNGANRIGSAGSNSQGLASVMMGCELTANAPGFRSDRVNLSTHRATDNPDIGTIILHRLEGVEGTSVSATSLSAPKDARKAWEKGVQLLQKNKPADAEKELQKAVEIYPKYANAWLDLGRARIQEQQMGPAREAMLKATEADDKLVEPWAMLGEMAARQQSWADAAKYLDRALHLDPVDYPRLWFEDAVADYNLKDYDKAEKNAREALKQPAAARDPHASQLLGIVLYNKKDYAGAAEAFRAYVQAAPNASDVEQVKGQIEQIDKQLGTAKQ